MGGRPEGAFDVDLFGGLLFGVDYQFRIDTAVAQEFIADHL